MKFSITIFLLLLVSCDNLRPQKKSSSKLPGLPETVKLGVTSEKELTNELGEPSHSYEVQSAIVNTYDDGKAIKVEDGVAKSYFRDPKGDEVQLQYWLQLWKDQTTISEKIESSKDVHGKFDSQLINREAKTTVVYSEETGLVKRVMHYEK